jgi:hypothetical protein
MLRASLRASAILAALAVSACDTPAPAVDNAQSAAPAAEALAPQEAAAEDWTALRASVGKYPSEIGLFETSPISGPLKALLGDRFAAFVANMEVQGPLQEEKDILYTSGNKAHEGGIEGAYLLIDPETRQLDVGLWEQGKPSHFGAELAKPTDIATFISNYER